MTDETQFSSYLGQMACKSCIEFIQDFMNSPREMNRCNEGNCQPKVKATKKAAYAHWNCEACWLKACLNHFAISPEIIESILLFFPEKSENKDDSCEKPDISFPSILDSEEKGTEQLIGTDSFEAAGSHDLLEENLDDKGCDSEKVKSPTIAASHKQDIMQSTVLRREEMFCHIRSVRTKHVCRSATTALRLPIACFKDVLKRRCKESNSEIEPRKKRRMNVIQEMDELDDSEISERTPKGCESGIELQNNVNEIPKKSGLCDGTSYKRRKKNG